MYSCDCKAEFSATILQSSVSRDPLEIIIYWFGAQEIFLNWEAQFNVQR